jgi:anti-anti-sigma factor
MTEESIVWEWITARGPGPATALLTLADAPGTTSEARALRLCVHRLVLGGARVVIVDLSRRRWTSAALIGALVHGQRVMEGRGGSLRLAGPSRASKRVLTASGLDSAFPVFPDVDRAVAAEGEAAPEPSGTHPLTALARRLTRRPASTKPAFCPMCPGAA